MLVVKVFYGDDVRRFRVSPSFEHEDLMNIVQENYPDLNTAHVIKYVDSEGDKCTLTKQTFADCVSHCENVSPPVLRLFIVNRESTDACCCCCRCRDCTCKGPKKTARSCSCKCCQPKQYKCSRMRCPWISRIEAPTVEKEDPSLASIGIHKGYTCDGCDESPIFGIKFTCEKCRNFDLCGNCFEQPKNPELEKHIKEHTFIAMTSEDTEKQRAARYQQAEQLPAAAAHRASGEEGAGVDADWTHIPHIPPHVEELLRSFGVSVDVGTATEALGRLSGSHAGGVIEFIRELKRVSRRQAQGTDTQGNGTSGAPASNPPPASSNPDTSSTPPQGGGV